MIKIADPSKDSLLQTLIERRVERLLTPLESFVRKQAAAGVLLIATALLALFLANSPWRDWLEHIGAMELGAYARQRSFGLPLTYWISDGLLALFFFLIGLEIKRELLIGQLRHPRHALLVLMGAIGGMVVPALIYLAFNYNSHGQSGWAIPMTTDTAFAIGVLALLARSVSVSASVFLAALAIIDDIVTILVIALFYTQELNAAPILKALIPLGLLFAINIVGIRRGWIYAILGIILWWYIHESGVHATLAGLLMAMAVPARPRIGQRSFIEKIRAQISDFEESKQPGQTILKAPGQHQLAANISETVKSASTPLQRWHSLFENPIAIIVLPLFALFHAGVFLSTENVTHALTSPVTLGIMAGLVIGKPLGIIAFSMLALRTRIAKVPEGMTFRELIGVGMVAGIGFTMSLFITGLGFKNYPELIEPAKIGILLSSVIAAIAGVVWFFIMGAILTRKPTQPTALYEGSD